MQYLMNKRIISIFLCTILTAQVEYSNNLNIRYGEGDNNYTYEEIYFKYTYYIYESLIFKF